MEPVLHRAAGLVLSAPCVLPGFVPLSSAEPVDVTFHPGASPPWALEQFTLSRHDATEIAVSRCDRGVAMTYADGTTFWISADATDIWGTWPEGATLADACTYLASSVLGYTLRMRGALALHASAVTIGGRAIALVGPHGSGKSTTAAALARRGHPVVCDDLLHLRRHHDTWLAEPYPGIVRLWPDAAAILFDDRPELPTITAGWDKRFLAPDRDGLPSATAPVPVAGLLLLAPRTPGPPSVATAGAATALVGLVANSAASLLLDARRRAAEFRILSDLVVDVRCGVATPSSDPARLHELTAAIEAWSAE